MVDRSPAAVQANRHLYQWQVIPDEQEVLDTTKRGWILPSTGAVHATFRGAVEEFTLNDRLRTMKRTSPTKSTRPDAHLRHAGLYALKDGLSENITNVQLPLSSLVDEGERPESERSALQCLDIPEGHMSDLAPTFDTIDVLEKLQGPLPYQFVDKYFDSFRCWATANTSHCHSPHHIDSAGAGTACRMLNRTANKGWGLKGASDDDPDGRFRASTWTSEAVPDHKGDLFDFFYVDSQWQL